MNKPKSSSVYLQPDVAEWLKRNGKSVSKQIKLDALTLQRIEELIEGPHGDCMLGKQIRQLMKDLERV